MTTVAPPKGPTVTELLDRLEALGTHREIAAFLAERGIKGTPSNCGLCPIARYLIDETGDHNINVGEDEVTIWRGRQGDVRHTLPPAVKDFIAFFDARLHPDLIDPDRPNVWDAVALPVIPA